MENFDSIETLFIVNGKGGFYFQKLDPRHQLMDHLKPSKDLKGVELCNNNYQKNIKFYIHGCQWQHWIEKISKES